MNAFIKKQVRIAIQMRKTKYSTFAESIGRTKQQFSHAIKRDSDQTPQVWQDILNGLDLELVAVPKGKSEKIAWLLNEPEEKEVE